MQKQTPPTADDLETLNKARAILLKLGDPAAANVVREFVSLLPEPEDEPEDDSDEPVIRFASKGSALRCGNRTRTCPTCKNPNRLTDEDRALGYQCDECADRAEGRGGYE